MILPLQLPVFCSVQDSQYVYSKIYDVGRKMNIAIKVKDIPIVVITGIHGLESVHVVASSI